MAEPRVVVEARGKTETFKNIGEAQQFAQETWGGHDGIGKTQISERYNREKERHEIVLRANPQELG